MSVKVHKHNCVNKLRCGFGGSLEKVGLSVSGEGEVEG